MLMLLIDVGLLIGLFTYFAGEDLSFFGAVGIAFATSIVLLLVNLAAGSIMAEFGVVPGLAALIVGAAVVGVILGVVVALMTGYAVPQSIGIGLAFVAIHLIAATALTLAFGGGRRDRGADAGHLAPPRTAGVVVMADAPRRSEAFAADCFVMTV